MPGPRRTVFFVSDGTGITVEMLGHSLLTQFDGIEFDQRTVPFIDSVEKAQACVSRINEASASGNGRPVVFTTLVNPEKHSQARRESARRFADFLVSTDADGQKSAPEITSPPLRVARARITCRLMPLVRNRHEPSMNRKLPPPVCAEWKLAGLPLGALTVYCRLWTTTAVIDGRQFWHGGRAELYGGGLVAGL